MIEIYGSKPIKVDSGGQPTNPSSQDQILKTPSCGSAIKAGLIEIYAPLHRFELSTHAYVFHGLVPGFGTKPSWVCHLFRLADADLKDGQDLNEGTSFDSTPQREARRLLLDLLLAAGEAGLWCFFVFALTNFVMRAHLD